MEIKELIEENQTLKVKCRYLIERLGELGDIEWLKCFEKWWS